jgi:hypothetical protein
LLQGDPPQSLDKCLSVLLRLRCNGEGKTLLALHVSARSPRVWLGGRMDVGVPRQPAPTCLCTQQRAGRQSATANSPSSIPSLPVSSCPRRGVAAQGWPDAAQHMENRWKLAGSARDGTANCWHAMLRLCVAWKGKGEAEACGHALDLFDPTSVRSAASQGSQIVRLWRSRFDKLDHRSHPSRSCRVCRPHHHAASSSPPQSIAANLECAQTIRY